MPYNPFEHDLRPQCRLECSWEEVCTESSARSALARFRRENPTKKYFSPEMLSWGYIWTEEPGPLDLSLAAQLRATKRALSVRTLVLFCQHNEHIAYSQSFFYPPDFVCDALLAEEEGRGSNPVRVP